MNEIKKFFKKYPELLTIPVAMMVWAVSAHILRWFDNTSGVFDLGIFQIPLFSVIQFFLYISMAWMAMKLLFGTLRRYLSLHFKSDFKGLTPWEKIKLSYAVFFVLLCVLAYLSNTLHA
jgi:hypothetical protein